MRTKRKSKPGLRQQVAAELKRVPEEYYPLLLQIVRCYRESIQLNSPAESLRRGWDEAQRGITFPIEKMWEGIDVE